MWRPRIQRLRVQGGRVETSSWINFGPTAAAAVVVVELTNFKLVIASTIASWFTRSDRGWEPLCKTSHFCIDNVTAEFLKNEIVTELNSAGFLQLCRRRWQSIIFYFFSGRCEKLNSFLVSALLCRNLNLNCFLQCLNWWSVIVFGGMVGLARCLRIVLTGLKVVNKLDLDLVQYYRGDLKNRYQYSGDLNTRHPINENIWMPDFW